MPNDRAAYERASALLNSPEEQAHRAVYQRWLAGVKAELAGGDPSVVGYPPGESGLKPTNVDIVVGSRKGIDGVAYPLIQPDVLSSELPDDGNQRCLVNSGLGLEQLHSVFDHSSTPADVGAAQGKARAGALDSAAARPRPVAPPASKITTWRTTMLSRLKAGLDRFEETPEADVIGAVALFAFVFLVLALGRLFDGGM